MSDSQFEALTEYISMLPFRHLDEAAKSSLSRVTDHVKDRAIGIITANRRSKPDPTRPGESLRVSNRENRSNNKSLEFDLRKAGYGFIRANGGTIETQDDGSKVPVLEPSYIVVAPKDDDGGKLKEFLSHHGQKYNQDAVMFKSRDDSDVYELSTHERNAPLGTQINRGKHHPGRWGEYFTALHGDAPSEKSRKEMTPEERVNHKIASLKQKAFVFESVPFEFSEDYDRPCKPEDLTFFARMGRAADKKKGLLNG